MKVFESPTIKLSGTGLLHSVPGHGHEDFILGLKNNLKVVNCFFYVFNIYRYKLIILLNLFDNF